MRPRKLDPEGPGRQKELMKEQLQTSDGRYVQVEPGIWWDTTGIDLVDQITVDGYLDDHPEIGIVLKVPAVSRLN